MKTEKKIREMLDDAIKEQEKNKKTYGDSYYSILEVWIEDDTKITILKEILEMKNNEKRTNKYNCV